MPRYACRCYVTGYVEVVVTAGSEDEAAELAPEFIDWALFEPSDIECDDVELDEEKEPTP